MADGCCLFFFLLLFLFRIENSYKIVRVPEDGKKKKKINTRLIAIISRVGISVLKNSEDSRGNITEYFPIHT